MAMKMRQSLAQLEREFEQEMQLDRAHRQRLRRAAVGRSRRRRVEREKKRSNVRFWLLAFSIIATAVIVTFAMFATLSFLLG